MLKILLPTTLPIAISALPCIEDRRLITNSGADVPNATIVRPITRSDILNRLATDAAPSVSALAPANINARPATNIKIFQIITFSLLFFTVAKI
jgi:hypothetical protein